MCVTARKQIVIFIVLALLVFAGCKEEDRFERKFSSKLNENGGHAETLRKREVVYTWVRESNNDQFEEYLASNVEFDLNYAGMYNLYEYAALSNNVEALKIMDDRYNIECELVVSSLQISLNAPTGMSVMDGVKYLINERSQCLTEEAKNELVFYVFDGGNAESIQGFSRLHPFDCKSLNSKVLSSALLGGVPIEWITMMYECGIRLDDQPQQFWDQALDNYSAPSDRKLIEKLKTSS